ncbi:TMV resistance protein N, partial [Trifolium medium]|nr:TMV resistance protein N [Trifolium medium]
MAEGFKVVLKTTIYLVYDEPNEEQTNHCHETDENGTVLSGDENSGCNHVDWDYEEVADEKDLIIMKQKSGLEVPTRV